METLIGLIMIYAWIHAVVVIFKKIKNLTTYEKVLLWVALSAFGITMLGVMYGQ